MYSVIFRSVWETFSDFSLIDAMRLNYDYFYNRLCYENYIGWGGGGVVLFSKYCISLLFRLIEIFCHSINGIWCVMKMKRCEALERNYYSDNGGSVLYDLLCSFDHAVYNVLGVFFLFFFCKYLLYSHSTLVLCA